MKFIKLTNTCMAKLEDIVFVSVYTDNLTGANDKHRVEIKMKKGRIRWAFNTLNEADVFYTKISNYIINESVSSNTK